METRTVALPDPVALFPLIFGLVNSIVCAGLVSDMNPHDCPRQCDCSHPSECIFNQVAPERPSYAVVWIVGAVTVALIAVILLLVL
jgi:hypothetical protein